MIVRTVHELESVIDSMSKEKRYSIDVESVDRGYPDITLVGISVGWTHKDGAYIPVGHAKGSQLPTELVLAKLKEFIEGNPNKVAVMHNCLNYYTPIWLADGSKMNIGEIVKKKLDVEVLSWDFETQKIVPKKVVNWFENGRKENWYKLSFRDGKVLYVTGDHEVYLKGNGSKKVKVSELNSDDKMLYAEYELTEEQVQVILGTLLGDASLIKDSEQSHARLSVGHCTEQRFYIEWKYKALSSICNSGIKEVVNDRGFSKKDGKLYRIRTKNTVQLDSIYDELYKEGTKKITNNYLERMDALALATWFMDDGSKSGRQLTLHCYSYSEEDVDTLVNWFENRWGIKARKQKRRSGFNLVFTGNNKDRLVDVIQPHVLEGFSYKIGVKGEGGDISTPETLYGEDIVEIEYLGKMKKPYGSIGYDIEVEDTHNYFANGLLVSNSKYDMIVLDLLGGIKFSENIFDTMIASWLLDTENPHGLKPLAKRYLNYAMTELDQIAPKERHPVTNDWVYRTDLVDIETMAKYAMDDATKPLQLMDIFLPRLEAEGQLKIFAELEMPKVFILKDIEMNGVRIDVETLKKRMEEAPNTLAEIEKRMYALRPNGKPFNANSPKQLNQVLFDELKIKPIGEPGKTGLYSTAKDVMEQWAGKYPIVDAILEYRQVSKLMGTYLEGLSKRIGPDGRIRTRFNQILTTGRLSSSSPNLQNIPRPDNDKFGLRDMFIAGPGKKLVGADYSQIELRVLAHISKDPTFIKAFTDNEDLHSYAAKMLFDLPEPLDEVKKLHPAERSVGKCVTGDTRVATKHGLVRIDSLSDFREPDKFTKLELPVLTKDGEQMTSYFYYGGKQKVLKVETKQGFKVAGTPNHKVLVRSGSKNVWKRLDELVIGDKLVTEVGGRSPESYVRIRENLWTSTKEAGESSPIIEIDENWGRLLGYVLGDGTVAPNQGVYFVVGGRYEEDIIADIQRIGNAIGLNVGVGQKKLRGGTEGVTCLTLGSIRLIRFLDNIGFSGWKGKKFSVPECIYRSPHSVVKEFLSALFETDGWVTTSGTGEIAMCTKSKSFAQEIQLLLGWLGIRATIYEQWNSTYEKYYYTVYVLKSSWHVFHDKVDFISSEKKKKLDMLCEQKESNRIVYAEVTMITEDEDEVFDFEVPDVHNFVGNGLVQHNTFNFSMVYGAGVKRLAATAKVSERRAKELKDKYMNRFHGIQRYLDTMHARAERDGYVSTIIGRRRHLKDAQLRGRSERENALKASALRQAGNSPVQGSAADILFIAMRNIRNRLIREGLTEKIKMVLQVHDELLFEVDEDIAEYAANLVKSEMETAVTLRVPLIADTAIGDRWSECK